MPTTGLAGVTRLPGAGSSGAVSSDPCRLDGFDGLDGGVVDIGAGLPASAMPAPLISSISGAPEPLL